MRDFVPEKEEEGSTDLPEAGFGEDDDGLRGMFPSGLSTISGKSPMGFGTLAVARAASKDTSKEDINGNDARSVRDSYHWARLVAGHGAALSHRDRQGFFLYRLR